MSIERFGSFYVPICDDCGAELAPCEEWNEALHTIKQEGWKHYRNEHGEWQDRCPDCEEDI